MSDLTTRTAGSADAITVMHYDANKRSTGIAYLLWFFLGGLGVHRFYVGRKGSGLAFLALTIGSVVLVAALYVAHLDNSAVMALPFIGYGIAGLWWLVDAFLIPGMTRTYNNELIARLSR